MKKLTRFLATLALGLLAACGEAVVPVPAPAAAGPGSVTIDVLDVGQGDAILIRSPEGKAALVDAGPSHDVAAQLRKLGVTGLDLAVVSHHHADHYGGLSVQSPSHRFSVVDRRATIHRRAALPDGRRPRAD